MVTLETDRLILRMLRESDLDAYAEMCGDPEVMRYIGDGQPLPRPMAWRKMAMMVGHWSLRGYGLWAAEETQPAQTMGDDQPSPGILVFQTTLDVGLQRRGTLRSEETPCPVGPRKQGKSSPRANVATKPLISSVNKQALFIIAEPRFSGPVLLDQTQSDWKRAPY